MSIPRRKPLSTKTGMRPAHRLDHLRQGVDRRTAAVLAAAAVVRDDDAVQRQVRRDLRVLVGQQPFTRIFIFVASRRRLKKSHVRFDDAPMPVRSIPSYIARRR
jgi:hypothetical protein